MNTALINVKVYLTRCAMGSNEFIEKPMEWNIWRAPLIMICSLEMSGKTTALTRATVKVKKAEYTLKTDEYVDKC